VIFFQFLSIKTKGLKRELLDEFSTKYSRGQLYSSRQQPYLKADFAFFI
jgi:hypothetical protein